MTLVCLVCVKKCVNIGEFWCSPRDTGGWNAAELSGEVSTRNKWGPGQPIVLKHRGLIQTVGLVLTCSSEAAAVRVSYHGEMLISKMWLKTSSEHQLTF